MLTAPSGGRVNESDVFAVVERLRADLEEGLLQGRFTGEMGQYFNAHFREIRGAHDKVGKVPEGKIAFDAAGPVVTFQFSDKESELVLVLKIELKLDATFRAAYLLAFGQSSQM